MKKKIACLAPLAVALLLVAFWSAETRSQTGTVKATGDNVVMIRCNPLAFTIAAFQGSPAAPARKASSCPEQLSILIKDGFTILDIGYLDATDQQSIIYTLAK